MIGNHAINPEEIKVRAKENFQIYSEIEMETKRPLKISLYIYLGHTFRTDIHYPTTYSQTYLTFYGAHSVSVKGKN